MYGKVFTQIYDGSLYGHWQALVTFQQMIVLADKYGVVDMTPRALSARTSIPFEIIEAGLRVLEEPDKQSRTPDEDGRRIVRLSDNRTWGWKIVNYEHYRGLRSQEERREYHKIYQREWRQKEKERKQSLSPVNDVDQSSKQYAISSKQLLQKDERKSSIPTHVSESLSVVVGHLQNGEPL